MSQPLHVKISNYRLGLASAQWLVPYVASLADPHPCGMQVLMQRRLDMLELLLGIHGASVSSVWVVCSQHPALTSPLPGGLVACPW